MKDIKIHKIPTKSMYRLYIDGKLKAQGSYEFCKQKAKELSTVN